MNDERRREILQRSCDVALPRNRNEDALTINEALTAMRRAEREAVLEALRQVALACNSAKSPFTIGAVVEGRIRELESEARDG